VFGDNYPSVSFVAETGRQKLKTIQRVAASRTNSPETSSMGRLFDAVSSLLCLRDVTNYEGQAAVELEQIANEHADHPYSFEFSNGVINAETVIQTIVADLLDGVPPAIISTRFHAGVASLITSIANRIRDEYKLNRVVLSGGVFQNSILVCATLAQLESAGFEVFTHRRVPPNDGGISLGQAAIANARLKHGTGRFVS
jgi:hydrogenase maturation protein HypF